MSSYVLENVDSINHAVSLPLVLFPEVSLKRRPDPVIMAVFDETPFETMGQMQDEKNFELGTE